MKAPKMPKPPNPYDQANAQAGANKQTAIASAILNNYDEDSPFGSVRYERIPGLEPLPGEQRGFGGGLRGRMSRMRGGGGSFGRGGSGSLYGDIPRFKRIVTLSPEQQKLYDQQTQLGQNMNDLAIGQVNRLQDVMSKPVTLDGLPELKSGINVAKLNTNWNPTGWAKSYNGDIADAGQIQKSVGADDFSQDRRRVEDAIMSRYDTRFAQDEERMKSQLAAQGLTPGSEAYNQQFQQLQQAKTDARMQAILAGGQEQSRLFGMDVTKGQFANEAQQQQYGQNADRARFGMEREGFNNAVVGQNNATSYQQFEGNNAAALQQQQAQQSAYGFDNSARAQAFQEMLGIRNQPINEIAALMNGGQVSVPQFTGPWQQGLGNIPIGDYMQNEYANKMQGYQAKSANRSAMMSGLFGLMAAPFGMMSDRRTKTDIKKVGKTDGGQPVYTYRYKHGGPVMMGVMAQNLEKKNPKAVQSIGGIKHVDYSKVR